MPRRLAAAAAAFSLVAAPCNAAELVDYKDPGARRSGAALGAYVRLPLGPRPAEQRGPVAGLRLTAVHDYRSAGAPRAALVESDTLDLRLTGRKPALYLAGVPVSDKERRKQNLTGLNTVVVVVLIAAAAVGGYYLARAIDDSGEE